MAWHWSEISQQRLVTCHPVLQQVLHTALDISPFDLRVLEGHRNEDRQNELFRAGHSQLTWPHSKHNAQPSLAVDVIPLPLDWSNRFAFHVLCGVMFSAANLIKIHAKGWRLRSGQDWNGNWRNADQTFHDAPHFELVKLQD